MWLAASVFEVFVVVVGVFISENVGGGCRNPITPFWGWNSLREPWRTVGEIVAAPAFARPSINLTSVGVGPDEYRFEIRRMMS